MPKILVIEDETTVRLNIVELLEADGFQVIEASSGSTGLTQTLQGHPDLIICDINLPDIDGFTVLENLRHNPSTLTTPFIFLTARTDRSDQRRGMDLGADDYITKPCTAEELRSAIWSRLKRRKHYEIELDKAKKQLERTLYCDSLTGLPNRLSLREQFEKLSQNAEGRQGKLSIFSIGIDRFNRINDSLGYHIGDRVLQSIAELMQTCLTAQDIVARIAGDQFILLVERPTLKELEETAQVCLNTVCNPLTIEGHKIHLTSSLGLVHYPQDGKDIETLIKRASIAMQRAKKISGNRILPYDSKLDRVTVERLSLEPDLRYALDHDQFRVYYQPRISLKTGQIVGAEALLRWFHPQRSFISPVVFISLAEELDLIGAIDEWVLRHACYQVRHWQQENLPLIKISVNLSAKQFSCPTLTTRILNILDETGLGADWLEMEITETSLVQNPEVAANTLKEMQDIGIRIALDDFGTGFSSLTYLQQFPLDILKIDQSFIRNVGRNSRSTAITLATLRMAKDLRLEVVAEGVETEEDLAFLCNHNCDAIQGYLFSPPVPADQFKDMLRAKRGLIIPRTLCSS